MLSAVTILARQTNKSRGFYAAFDFGMTHSDETNKDGSDKACPERSPSHCPTQTLLLWPTTEGRRQRRSRGRVRPRHTNKNGSDKNVRPTHVSLSPSLRSTGQPRAAVPTCF